MFKILTNCLLLLVFSYGVVEGCGIPPHRTIQEIETQKNIDYVLFLMQKRLAIMHEVARAKWNQKLPIEDLPRERQLLSALAEQGKSYGLEEEWTRHFFQRQFDAAKFIQKEDFEIWSQQKIGQFDTVLDLKNDIRPYLDQLSNDLLKALPPIFKDAKTGSLDFAMPLSSRQSDAIEEKVWQMALIPFQE